MALPCPGQGDVEALKEKYSGFTTERPDRNPGLNARLEPLKKGPTTYRKKWAERQSPWQAIEARLRNFGKRDTRMIPVIKQSMKLFRGVKTSRHRRVRFPRRIIRKQPSVIKLVDAGQFDGLSEAFSRRTYYHALADTLSMADINRYQFQKNHSRETGITRVSAGGGKE